MRKVMVLIAMLSTSGCISPVVERHFIERPVVQQPVQQPVQKTWYVGMFKNNSCVPTLITPQAFKDYMTDKGESVDLTEISRNGVAVTVVGVDRGGAVVFSKDIQMCDTVLKGAKARVAREANGLPNDM